MFPGSGTLICTMEDGSIQEAVMDMSTHISGIERPEQGFLKGSYREQQYRIPEREGHLEEKIEFQDCTLYLTRIKKLDERYDYGTDKNNQKITKPMVYLSARVENKTKGKYLDWVLGCQTGEKSPLITIPEFTEAKDWTQRELLGFKAPYDEEAAELQLQFENPRFLWDQEFVLQDQEFSINYDWVFKIY